MTEYEVAMMSAYEMWTDDELVHYMDELSEAAWQDGGDYAIEYYEAKLVLHLRQTY